MIQVRRGDDRGKADHGWLQSRHTFSFADYWDPDAMGFSHLRVINEDRVAPSRGFGAHPHRDMEIVTYVIEGELAHRDSLGTGSVIRPGEVQRMSAGTGIVHSEVNPSGDRPVHFLQIWILPRERGGPPSYQQETFAPREGLTLLVSPDGRDGSLTIGQDTDLWRAVLPAGATAEHPTRGRHAWIQVVKGALDVEGERLVEGDGAALRDVPMLRLAARSDVEALVFDLE